MLKEHCLAATNRQWQIRAATTAARRRPWPERRAHAHEGHLRLSPHRICRVPCSPGAVLHPPPTALLARFKLSRVVPEARVVSSVLRDMRTCSHVLVGVPSQLFSRLASARQRSEQYLTVSQFFSHFFRHAAAQGGGTSAWAAAWQLIPPHAFVMAHSSGVRTVHSSWPSSSALDPSPRTRPTCGAAGRGVSGATQHPCRFCTTQHILILLCPASTLAHGKRRCPAVKTKHRGRVEAR
jgi:hypothetical protein